MSLIEVSKLICSNVDNTFENKIETINVETNLLEETHELFKEIMTDDNVIIELNEERIHFHFEDEKKQIIYTMLINLIILKINEKINSDEKKFKMVYYSAKSQMDSKYIVCIELSH